MRIKALTCMGTAVALVLGAQSGTVTTAYSQGGNYSGVGPGVGPRNDGDVTFGRSAPSQENTGGESVVDEMFGWVLWGIIKECGRRADCLGNEAREPRASVAQPPPDLSRPVPPAWRVNGVSSWDTLNMRDNPAGKIIIGEIPANGRGIRIRECRQSPSRGLWCFAEYAGRQGWVSAKYLLPDR